MVHTGSHQRLHQKLSLDKRKRTLSSANFFEAPKIKDADSHSLGSTRADGNVIHLNIGNLDSKYSGITLNSGGGEEHENSSKQRGEDLRIAVLVWLFLEKAVEILVIFLFTLLAILWSPLFNFLRSIFWPLIGFTTLFSVVSIVLFRIEWFRHCPGCLIYKLVYLHFLMGVFFTLAIHFPKPLPYLSSYFALIAAGIVAATYILFAFIALSHKHLCKVDAKGSILCLYGMVMPICVLVVSQPIYYYGGIDYSVISYKDYMLNIVVGIVTSLPFSYEALFIYQRFVNSRELEEFVKAPGLLPGFVTAVVAKKVDATAEPALEQTKAASASIEDV